MTNVPRWHCYYCSTVTLLRLFHSEIVVIVPHLHCFDCSIVTMLRLVHSYAVTVVPRWDCYDPREHFNVGSMLFQRCRSTLDQRWNNIHPTLNMKQNPTLNFKHFTTLIQRRCPTLKKRWNNVNGSLSRHFLNMSPILVKAMSNHSG